MQTKPTALHQKLRCCIVRNKLKNVLLCIYNGIEINEIIPAVHTWDPSGTPLGLAVSYNKQDIVKVLIKKGADVNKCDDSSTTLDRAMEIGNMDIIRDLIAAGANVNEVAPNGKPLLVKVAARFASLEILKLLICKGIDVNASNGEVIAILLKYNKNDALYYLLQNGMDVNQTSNSESTPLLYAVENNNTEMVEWLLDNGAKPSVPSAFMKAVETQNLEMVKFLVETGVDVNIQVSHETPLLKAIQKGDIDIVEYLLKMGANPNLEICDITPLFTAIQFGRLEIVKRLIEHNVHLDIVNDEGNTPLMVALDLKENEILEVLILNNILKPTEILNLLLDSIEDENVEAVEFLSKTGINLDVSPNFGFTPLTRAADLGDDKIVKILVKNGANVNKMDSNGNTALLIAAEKGDFEIIDFLINSGCDMEQDGDKLDKIAEKNYVLALYLVDVRGKMKKDLNVDKNSLEGPSSKPSGLDFACSSNDEVATK